MLYTITRHNKDLSSFLQIGPVALAVGSNGRVDTLGFMEESFPLPGVPTKFPFPASRTHFVGGAVNGGELRIVHLAG